MGRWLERVSPPRKFGQSAVSPSSKSSKFNSEDFEGTPQEAFAKISRGAGGSVSTPAGNFEDFEGTLHGAFSKISAANPSEEAERSAIAEYDGGIPQAWADGFARLQTVACPAWVNYRRWWHMLDDAGRFLDQWGAKLAALGWTTEEVFGIDGAAPLRRLDLMGLAWILDGFEVIAATKQTATLRHRRTGARQTYRRVGQAGKPLWEIVG